MSLVPGCLLANKSMYKQHIGPTKQTAGVFMILKLTSKHRLDLTPALGATQAGVLGPLRAGDAVQVRARVGRPGQDVAARRAARADAVAPDLHLRLRFGIPPQGAVR